MASFPVIQGSNNSSANTTTSHSVSMPASIVAGEKLVVVFSCDSTATVDTPSGWTKSVDVTNGVVRLAIYTKTAAGSDTLTVTTSGNTDSGHAAYRIVTNNSIQIATNTSSEDPPNLTPSGGSGKYTWIAGVGSGGSASVSAYPTNYSSNQVTNTAEDFMVAMATDDVEASSENPATYTLSGGSNPLSFTIAIEEQDGVVGSFSLIQQSSQVIQPTIDYPAQASFSLITMSSSINQPTATAENKTVWTNEAAESTTWTNEAEL